MTPTVPRAVPRTAAPRTAAPRSAVPVPRGWAATEPVTCPIPIVEPVTCPIPVVGGLPAAGSARHTRHAAVLTGLVGLILLAALLLALGLL